MASTKKMDVPDISGLLGKISEKRHDLPKAPTQRVQVVEEKPAEPKADETAKRKHVKTAKHSVEEVRGVGGRPSVKKEDIEYVKLSPRIPLELKRKVVDAINYNRYQDEEGNVIKTMDEFVALAIARLLGNTGRKG